MTDWLGGYLDGVFVFLGNVLPSSPVSGWLGSSDGLALGLGWLNWVFPVGDCVAIFGAWMAAVTAVCAGSVVLDAAKKVAGFLLA